MNLILLYAFFSLVCLNIFDLYSTNILLDLGAYEANPVAKWIIDKSGVIPGLLIYKISIIIFLGIIVYRALKDRNMFTTREYNLLFYGTISVTLFYFYFMLFNNFKYLLVVI